MFLIGKSPRGNADSEWSCSATLKGGIFTFNHMAERAHASLAVSMCRFSLLHSEESSTKRRRGIRLATLRANCPSQNRRDSLRQANRQTILSTGA